ncbi:MAG: polysaccharide deacetylase family protein, partial [Solirubrobacteraceae bacterium]
LGAALAVIAVAARGGSGGAARTSPTAHAARAPHASPSRPPASSDLAVKRLAAFGLPLYCGGTGKPLVALTYDDGPGPYTLKMIHKLKRHHLQATFFLVGKSIRSYPGLARLERSVAVLGDRTLSHPFLPGLAAPAMAQEISGAQTLIERSSGQRTVDLFRPPYGARSPAIDREAKSRGLLEVIWTIDSADSLGANYAGIASNVINGLRPGSIILMHENRGQTIRATLPIFTAIARKHLRAVTLPELLAQDPPTLAQLRAGGRGCGTRSSTRTGA